MAIKEISEPKPGSYLLIWQQAGLTGASGLPHQYAIEIKNSHGRCLHRWISPQPVTPEYKTATLALTLTAADCRTSLTLTLTPIEDDTRSYNLYGFGLMGCLALFLLLTLMADKQVALDLSRTFSVLGYALLPIVSLAAVNVLLSLQGALGAVLGVAAVLWATTAATRIFESAMQMSAQRWLIAYPVFLLYFCFA
jgi:hypothetical protein